VTRDPTVSPAPFAVLLRRALHVATTPEAPVLPLLSTSTTIEDEETTDAD